MAQTSFRKFKITFSAIHYDDVNKKYVPDNCVEVRTNDIGIAPVIKYQGPENSNAKVEAFQIYVGGGQGQPNMEICAKSCVYCY